MKTIKKSKGGNKMKSALKILLIPVLLLIVVTGSYSKLLTSQPEIKFNDSNYNFGDVKEGVELEHIFKFTNDGEGTLVINSVQPSCGCTGVVMDEKKEFESGESGEIKITFNTQGRSGMNSKTVIVNTNDPVNPVTTLSFNCNVTDN
ncbi:MAG: DUF1573 domain-containing protein [Ignavibacteriae bacterium]|nr:DUF1573 domain-containing protein [Ignavibacteriota bacterium]